MQFALSFPCVSQTLVWLQENSEDVVDEESLPPGVLGFRRVLAGIYSHTSVYVVAAPMAHHIALEGSRFRFSHDQSWLPADGVKSMLDGEAIVMKFKKVGGKHVIVHSGMKYLYRPQELEGMCLYQFFREIMFMPRRTAEKKEIEHYDFLDDYPCSPIEVAVYRDTPAVPCFAWNFLGSTAGFQSSILDAVDESKPDYAAKEEYAKKFMVLFMPLRSAEDIKVDGSHQKALHLALNEDRIDDEMIEIANNIQNIHNSLNSELVDDPLLSTTILEEAEEATPAEQEEEDPNFAAYLDSIGDYFASTQQSGANLSEDATELNPKTVWKPPGGTDVPRQPAPGLESVAMESVISFGGDEPERPPIPPSDKERFRTTTKQLNSLAMTRKFTTDPDDNRQKVNANGTWDSIVAYGKIAGLDREQQTAYEILAATYVLSFCTEAEGTLPTEAERQHFRKQKSRLCRLARRRRNASPDRPLRMFVTGPAGAGKSKQRSAPFSSSLPHSTHTARLTRCSAPPPISQPSS